MARENVGVRQRARDIAARIVVRGFSHYHASWATSGGPLASQIKAFIQVFSGAFDQTLDRHLDRSRGSPSIYMNKKIKRMKSSTLPSHPKAFITLSHSHIYLWHVQECRAGIQHMLFLYQRQSFKPIRYF